MTKEQKKIKDEIQRFVSEEAFIDFMDRFFRTAVIRSKFKTLAAMFWYIVNGRDLTIDIINNLLFLSDAYHFTKTGKTLSNVEYIKRPGSPVPIGIEEVCNILKKFGYISECKSENNYFSRYKYTAKSGDVKKVVLDINNGDTNSLDKVIASYHSLYVKFIDLKAFEPWKSTAWNQVLDFNKIDYNFKEWMRDHIKKSEGLKINRY